MRNRYVTPTHSTRSMRAKPTTSPFAYYGAKLKVARAIVQRLPPHHAWVEGFCGSAALTLAKPPVPIEVINDADGEIVNVFEQLRNNTKELCRAVALTPYAREEYQRARETRPDDLDPVERARRFLVATMMTVNAAVAGGTSGFSFSTSYSREGREARVNRWYRLPERLEQVTERLRGVRVENRDACELLEMFVDRPATLVYLDPPYFVRRRHGYVIDANDVDFHRKLLKLCRKARCMILISGYQNEIYDELLRSKDGWSKRSIQTHTRDTRGTDYARTEVLWMNSRFLKAQRTGKVSIRLNSAERSSKKLNPPRAR